MLFRSREIDCLADNIYHEARNEPIEGMMAVGMVTMNRLSSGFADSVCKVVKQKKNNTCQFSWHCEKKFHKVKEKQYNYARGIAVVVYFNHKSMKDHTDGALFFHADYVRPKWKNMQFTAQIGRHIFYKKKELT